MCAQCKALDSLLAKNASSIEAPEKLAHTLPSSHFPMSYLSPASLKVRQRRLQKERKNLAQKLKKYDHLSVNLCSEQSADMANTINDDPNIRSELDEILLEADKHEEGHGSTLQDIWDGDSMEADEEVFNFDQTRNSKSKYNK